MCDFLPERTTHEKTETNAGRILAFQTRVSTTTQERKRVNSWFSHDVIKIEKRGIINPFQRLVSLVIRTSEYLSFLQIFSLIGFFVL